MNLNSRRTPQSAHRPICVGVVVEGCSYCRYCKCNQNGCHNTKSKFTKRWCTSHSHLLKTSDYCTEDQSRNFIPQSSNAVKTICRANYLLERLTPDDVIAWQEVVQAFNAPSAGSLMTFDGVVIGIIAHAIKWPPAIREFRRLLLVHTTRPITAVQIVTAYHDTVTWSDGKKLKNMHAGLSVSRRVHATTGLMITAKQLGVITAIPKGEEPDPGAVLVRLGLNATPHVLKPRHECTDTVLVVSKYLEYAAVARLHWPCPGSSFLSSAGESLTWWCTRMPSHQTLPVWLVGKGSSQQAAGTPD